MDPIPSTPPDHKPPSGPQSEVLSGTSSRGSGWARPAAFAAAGLVAGGVLAGSMSAMADDTGSASPSASQAAPGEPGTVDESQPQRSDEKLLTGDTASKVTAAALTKYPGATVLRVETDSDGVYEAHLVTSDGTRVTVEVGSDFAVTGVEQGGPGGHGGAPGGHGPDGDGDGDGPGGDGDGDGPGASPEATPGA